MCVCVYVTCVCVAQAAISTWGSEEEDADLQVFFRKVNDVQDQWFAIQAAYVEHYEQHVAMWETILHEVKTLDPLTKSLGAAESKLEKRRKALEKAKAKVDFEAKRGQLEADVDEAEAQLEQAIRERDTRSDEISAFKKDKFAASYSTLTNALITKHETGSSVKLEILEACGRLDERFASSARDQRPPQLSIVSGASGGASGVSSPSPVMTPRSVSGESGDEPSPASPTSYAPADRNDVGSGDGGDSSDEEGDPACALSDADEPELSESAVATPAASDVGIDLGGVATDASGVESGDGAMDGGGAPVEDKEPVQARVRALYDYTAEEESDLSFKAGDIINVAGKDPDGWWLGEKDGVEGLIPSNYVVEVDPDE